MNFFVSVRNFTAINKYIPIPTATATSRYRYFTDTTNTDTNNLINFMFNL